MIEKADRMCNTGTTVTPSSTIRAPQCPAQEDHPPAQEHAPPPTTPAPPPPRPTKGPSLNPLASAQEDSDKSIALILQKASAILRGRCPACFGGKTWGRGFQMYVLSFGWAPKYSLSHYYSRGPDVLICIDGNFNHRHLVAQGDCPPFYSPEYMLPKEFVDAIGEEIEKLRKARKTKKRGKKKTKSKKGKGKGQGKGKGTQQREGEIAGSDSGDSTDSDDEAPPQRHKEKVPKEAVRGCEKSHEAGSGSNVKTYMEKFDDSGLMAAVCRHDIPLFLCNIDTPGEQQKYAVALIRHVFEHLPDNATVKVLYDVGCVLDRSRDKVRASMLYTTKHRN